VAALCAATPVTGQTVLSVRVGGIHASYADLPGLAAVTISPRVEFGGVRSRGTAEVGYSRFENGASALQGGLEAAASRRLARVGSLALFAGVSGNLLEGGTWSATGQGSALLGRSAGPFILYGGLTGGALRRVGGAQEALFGAQAAASTRLGPAIVNLRGQRIAVGPETYSDLLLMGVVQRGRFTVDLAGGLRHFDAAETDPTWQARLAVEVLSGLALETAVGAWPRSQDGFTRGFYAVGGVRVSRALRGARALVERTGERGVRLTLPVRGARSVAIAGEWNDWTPVPMRAEGSGRWSAELPLSPGAWRFAIVVDGERWTVPQGVPRMSDDFGGEVGVLVVR
jgi:hypothetical protein